MSPQVLQVLQPALGKEGFKLASQFHTRVVDSLRAAAGAGGEGAPAAGELQEQLQAMLPAAKALALGGEKGGQSTAGGAVPEKA